MWLYVSSFRVCVWGGGGTYLVETMSFHDTEGMN